MVQGGTARLTPALAIVTTLAWMAGLIVAGNVDLPVLLGFIPVRPIGDVSAVPAVLTPLTATLAHSGVLHVGFNMLLLIICGRDVETVIGWKPLLVLYVVAAYAAAAAQYVADPGSPVPMIGASGAISGVVAVYALLFSRNEVRAIGPVPSHWVRALWLAAGWIGIQALTAVAAHGSPYAIATAAHVGGFLAGLALARPLLAWRYRSA